MSDIFSIPNARILEGESTTRAANAYRALVAAHGHDTLCTAYGLDTDAVNGGTHWTDVVRTAYLYGDIDPESGDLT